jgi:hypothetical protein
MKRFLAYYFVVIALFAGVVSTTAFRNISTATVSADTDHKQSFPNHQQSFFLSADLFLSSGVNSEQIRLTNSIQHCSTRVFSSLLNTFRINHSIQLSLQKYFTVQTSFLLNSANKQLDGYYLYHLRKLLI